MPPHIPSFKLIPGTDFSVDAFRYPLDRLKAYFLTHAHGDHYTGLSEKWSQGPIYCTEVTGKLVCHITGVSEDFINVLPMNKEVKIYGVKVTAVDANHCPGAALLLFQVSNGDKYVHCGDFRGCKSMQQCPHLQRFIACKGLFLDTTYCHPKHVFPAQSVAVEEVGRLCEQYAQDEPKRLILVSSYTIGKERLFMEIARRCKVKICVTQAKFDVMKLLPWPEDLPLEQLFTTDPHSSPVHVVQWNWLGETWYGFKSVVGFVPTGFAFQKSADSFPVYEKAPWKIHLIPYSEHSSFSDLQEFVGFLRPQHIIPTVGVSGEKGDTSVHKMLEHFRHLCDQSGAKRAFLGRLAAAAGASKDQNTAAIVQDKSLQDTELYEAGTDAPYETCLGKEGKEREATDVVDVLSEDQGLEQHLKSAVQDRSGSAAVNNCDAEQDAAGASTSYAATGEQEESKQNQPVGTLMAVIGDSITEADALKLLKQCGNSIDRAANCFYDQTSAPKPPLDASRTTNKAPATTKQSQDFSSSPAASSSGRKVKEKVKKPAQSASKVKEMTKKPGPSTKQTHAKSPKVQKQDKSSSNAANQKSIMAFMQSPKQSSSAMKCKAVKHKDKNVSGSCRGQKRPFSCVTEQINGSQDAGELFIDMTEEFDEVDIGKERASGPQHVAGVNDAQKARVPKSGATCDVDTQNCSEVKESSEAVNGRNSGSAPISAHQGSRKLEHRDNDQNHDDEIQKQPQQGTNESQEKPKLKLPSISLATDCSKASASPAKVTAVDTDEENTGSQAVATAKVPPQVTGASAGSVPDECSVLLPLERYCPRKHACWSRGATPYMHIAQTFAAMDSTTKRLRIGDALTNMFRAVMLLAPTDLEAAALLTVGKLAADYEGVELHVGGSTVASAVMDCTGVTNKRITEMYKTDGDLGDVAEKCKSNQRILVPHAALTVKGVFAKLHEIASTKGTRSAQRKQGIMCSLLRASRGPEVKFIVRTLVQNLRVGANWRSVVRALGCAAAIHFSHDNPQSQLTPQISQAQLNSYNHTASKRSEPSQPESTAGCHTGAAQFPSKQQLTSAAEAAVEAFHSCPSLAKIVQAVQSGGVEQLRHLGASVGVPVKPMLAKITAGVGDCVKQTTGAPVLVEWKYDGQRAQIHVAESGEVTIYSRNCENKTAMFPDVCTCILQACRYSEVKRSFIVDSELVAVDRANGNRLRAFQDLSTRAREGVSEQQVSVHVCIFLFDILYLDREALMQRPFRERRSALASVFTALKPGFVELAQSYELRILTDDTNKPQLGFQNMENTDSKPEHMASDQVQEMHAMDSERPARTDIEDESLNQGKKGAEVCEMKAEPVSERGNDDADCSTEVKTMNVCICQQFFPEICLSSSAYVAEFCVWHGVYAYVVRNFDNEGLMLKFLDTRCAYEPSKRADSWLKLKKDYCEGLRDSLDLVPIGAWHGNGRKAGWYSPFLLACWDPEREEFQSLCRVMSGFSDAFYKASKERYDRDLLVPSKLPYVNTSETPDVWFMPTEVWEIRGADLTLSPVHKAAVGRLHPDRGCSLRFPRFIQMREDKAPEDASGPDYISDLFKAQTRKADNCPDTEAPPATEG